MGTVMGNPSTLDVGGHVLLRTTSSILGVNPIEALLIFFWRVFVVNGLPGTLLSILLMVGHDERSCMKGTSHLLLSPSYAVAVVHAREWGEVGRFQCMPPRRSANGEQ